MSSTNLNQSPEPEPGIPRIPVVATLSRLVDTYMYVTDSLDAHARHRDEIVGRHISGVSELAEAHGFLQLPIPELNEIAREHFAQLIIESAEQKAAEFAAWVRNQGLVTLCTVLDVFLEAFVDAVLQTRVEILYGSAGAKSIELKHIVNLGPIERIIAEFRNKEVRAFAFEDIDKRFRFLESRLGLRIDETFRFQRFTADAQAALAGWDLERLVGIYRDRHEIVHRVGSQNVGTP